MMIPQNIFDANTREELIYNINMAVYSDAGMLYDCSMQYLRSLEKKERYAELCDVVNILFVIFPRDDGLVNIAQKNISNFYNFELKSNLEKNYDSALLYLSEIISKVDVKSVVDFGAGAGSWIRAAEELGINNIVGVEKYYSISTNSRVLKQDICQPINEKFDLAISVEVAEHLEPNMSEAFVDNITSSSSLIIFGAANENQPGDAHMNCRDSSYWASIFKERGYECVDYFRAKFWDNDSVNHAYVQNTFLYIRNGSMYRDKFQSNILHNIAHPSLINPHYLNKHRKQNILFSNI